MDEQAPVSDTDQAACTNHVLMLFEDIDRQYLDDLAQEHSFNPDAVIAIILDRQEQDLPYPRRTNPLKRKRDDDADAEDGEIEHPKNDIEAKFDDPQYEDQMRSTEYKDMATVLISQDFPMVPKTTIRSKLLSSNGSSVFRTYLAMDNASRNWDDDDPPWIEKKTATKHMSQYSAVTIQDLNLDALTADRRAALDEFIAARAVKAKKDAEKSADDAERQNHERAMRNGESGECGCCFDEFALNRMVHCEGGTVHLFCRGCMKQQAETTIGYSKHEITCLSMDGCSAGFSSAQRDTFLDKKLKVALNRIEAQAALEAAGIADLETCPFCPMAMEYPPVEENKEFRCTNPSCEAVSCRCCRKLTHIPKTCAEAAAAEEGHSARHTIEEAMSDAIIRKCNKCSNPYIKQEGCNKISCTRCKTLQCYVCRQTVTDYSHFNDKNRGGKNGQCPLFDSTEVRHQDEVRQAEELSRLQVIKDNPEVNGEALKLGISAGVEEDEQKRRDREARHGHGVIARPDLARIVPDGPVADGALMRDQAERLVEFRHLEGMLRARERLEGQEIANAHGRRANNAARANVERVARFQQQVEAQRNAAQALCENLLRQRQQLQHRLQAAQAPNLAGRDEAQLDNIAQPVPQRRHMGQQAAAQHAANMAAQVHRNMHNDNVFMPLRLGAHLGVLRQMADPLQHLLNDGMRAPAELELLGLGDLAGLGAMDRVQDQTHRNVNLHVPPPALVRVRQAPGPGVPVGQARSRPAAPGNQPVAPANRVRDARA